MYSVSAADDGPTMALHDGKYARIDGS